MPNSTAPEIEQISTFNDHEMGFSSHEKAHPEQQEDKENVNLHSNSGKAKQKNRGVIKLIQE